MTKWEDIFDKWLSDDNPSEENSKNKELHIHDNTINLYFCSIPKEKTKEGVSKKKKEQKSSKINLHKLRNSPLMKKWKKKIRTLDEGECQCCGERIEQGLEIHHIMPLRDYPNLGIEEGNGIALCSKCHKKYHEMYNGNENAANFAKFMRDYANRIYR